MPYEFKLPDPGEGIHEAEIIEVLVKEGDKVEDGQSILVVETDKASIEIPSPVTGIVAAIKVKVGDIVQVGEVVMIFEAEASGRQRAATTGREAKPDKAKEEAPSAEEKESKRPAAGQAASAGRKAAEEKAAPAAAKSKGPVPAAPSTRRLARELGVDLAQVAPSGPGGRVTPEDVRRFAEGEKGAEPSGREEGVAKPKAAAAAPKAAALPDFSRWGTVERIALRSIRRATARQMALSWERIPHVLHQDVADITELEAFRLENKAEIQKQGGSLTLTIFTLKAAVAALKAHPRFNASLDEEAGEIILKKYYDINVAVDTERGLITPVIRSVDCKSMADLAVELPGLTERTRSGGTELNELVGGTFTITNIGPLGGTGLAPIINYPQSAILGLARARLQPVVRGDSKKYEVTPRLMLPLTLAFDHRLADGADAARFLNTIIDLFEHPKRLMLV